MVGIALGIVYLVTGLMAVATSVAIQGELRKKSPKKTDYREVARWRRLQVWALVPYIFGAIGLGWWLACYMPDVWKITILAFGIAVVQGIVFLGKTVSALWPSGPRGLSGRLFAEEPVALQNHERR